MNQFLRRLTPGEQVGALFVVLFGLLLTATVVIFALSLRETLFLGAALGIFIPALVLAFFQVNSKLESEVEIRVRAPMQQQAGVLSRSLGMAIWMMPMPVRVL